MRKLLILAALALVALSAIAVPASASGIPHDDYNPNNWVAVDTDVVYDNSTSCDLGVEDVCPFSAASTASYPFNLMVRNMWGGLMIETYNCEASFDAEIARDGSFTTSNLSVGGSGQNCEYLDAEADSWAGTICAYVADGFEAWSRQDVSVDFNTWTYTGPMFGSITPWAHAGGDSLTVSALLNRDALVGVVNLATPSVSFELNQTLSLNTTQEPCSWPELQA